MSSRGSVVKGKGTHLQSQEECNKERGHTSKIRRNVIRKGDTPPKSGGM